MTFRADTGTGYLVDAVAGPGRGPDARAALGALRSRHARKKELRQWNADRVVELVRATGDTIALCPPLVAEASHLKQIFDVLVRDFSHFALALHNKASSTPAQMEHCLGMLHKPHRDEERYQRVWEGHVLPQADRYAMNP